MIKKFQGVILQTRKYGDSSLILIVLTKEIGKISIIAKGVRKSKSNTSAYLQTSFHIEFEMIYKEDKDLQTLRKVDLLSNYKGIPSNLDKTKIAYLACEFAIKTIHDHDSHSNIYDLLCSFLLTVDKHQKENILLVRYLIRLSSVIGFEIDINNASILNSIFKNSSNIEIIQHASSNNVKISLLNDVTLKKLKELILIFQEYFSKNFDKNLIIKSINVLDY